MPIALVTLDLLHHVSLATGRHYGISVDNTAHHKVGGIMNGILDDGKMMAEFDCVSISRGLNILQQCDGDHLICLFEFKTPFTGLPKMVGELGNKVTNSLVITIL